VLERALEGGGFGASVESGHLRIGRKERMAKMRPLSSRAWTGQPINLSIREADLRDFARLFADISGLAVDLPPPGPYEPVTILVHELPWDEAFELIAASYGWSWRIDGDHLRVEVPPAGR